MPTPQLSTKPLPLVRPARAKGAPAVVDASDLHVPVLLVGGGILLTSLCNLVLLWWGPQFGVPQWEFLTVSQTLDRLPLVVLSVLLLAVGVLPTGSVWATRSVAALSLLAALAVVGVTGLYGLASGAAWQAAAGISPEALSMVKKALLRAAVTSLTSTVLFAALGVMLWRRTRSRSS